MKLQSIVLVSVLAVSPFALAGGPATNQQKASAGDKPSPEVMRDLKLGDIERDAYVGGYKDKLDESIEKYGGTRTKEVMHERQRIQNGSGQGQGHAGETTQPGLSGTEGPH